MKALTLRGPLLSEAILQGQKRVENRTWSIPPGWYALHTGSGTIKPEVLKHVLANWVGPVPVDLPTSAIVGFVLMGVSTRPETFSGWETGPVLNPILRALRLPRPILGVKGQLGLWNVKEAGINIGK